MAAILATAIGVKYQSCWWATPEPGHTQRIRHHAVLNVVYHTPALNLTAEQVDYDCQIQPTFIGGDVRDVTRPHLIGGLGCEVAI